jgi:hypothetical protein
MVTIKSNHCRIIRKVLWKIKIIRILEISRNIGKKYLHSIRIKSKKQIWNFIKIGQCSIVENN